MGIRWTGRSYKDNRKKTEPTYPSTYFVDEKLKKNNVGNIQAPLAPVVKPITNSPLSALADSGQHEGNAGQHISASGQSHGGGGRSFLPSAVVVSAQTGIETGLNNAGKVGTGKVGTVSSAVPKFEYQAPTMNYTPYEPSQFQASQAYIDAMNYTNGLLMQLQGGTGYSGALSAVMNEYMNREDFSYDSDTDPMFQKALASAMKDGKRAMADTMGQAAALTGGYGSSYATSAGANAYNQFVDEAYDNIPQYYQMALDAYNMEGDKLINQYNMLSQADANAYQRMFNEYQASYNATQDMYNKEYQNWADAENIRQYENDFAYRQYLNELDQYNYNREFEYQMAQDKLANDRYIDEFNYRKEQDAIANQLARENYMLDVEAQNSKLDETPTFKAPTQAMFDDAVKAAAKQGASGLISYANTLPQYDSGAMIDHVENSLSFTKVEDTVNGFGGVDHDDRVRDRYGNEYTLDELKEMYGLTNAQLKKFNNVKEGEEISFVDDLDEVLNNMFNE